MRFRWLLLLAAPLVLAACDARPRSDSGRPAGALSATESAAIDAAAGRAAGAAPAPGPSGAVDGAEVREEDAEWAALEAEFESLPPIRSGPMAAASSEAEDGAMDELSAERRMQSDLPRADGPLWRTLRQTRISIDERTQLYKAVHPPAVQAMAGRTVTVRGYMLPLESSARTSHFLVSPYTPVCFFHPPAEPNEVIEVRLGRPIEAGYHLVEVTGVLQLADNGEKGLFFLIPQGTGRIVERVG